MKGGRGSEAPRARVPAAAAVKGGRGSEASRARACGPRGPGRTVIKEGSEVGL